MYTYLLVIVDASLCAARLFVGLESANHAKPEFSGLIPGCVPTRSDFWPILIHFCEKLFHSKATILISAP
jgi:hypothetical protein